MLFQVYSFRRFFHGNIRKRHKSLAFCQIHSCQTPCQDGGRVDVPDKPNAASTCKYLCPTAATAAATNYAPAKHAPTNYAPMINACVLQDETAMSNPVRHIYIFTFWEEVDV